MMIDPLQTLLAFVFGIIVGAAYFWALWHSARAITRSKTPWRAALSGGGVRMALLFGSFAILVLVGVNAAELFVWLVGLLGARIISIRLVTRADLPPKEASS